jgi:hypothetical protein
MTHLRVFLSAIIWLVVMNALWAVPVMLLWDYLMPTMLKLPTITYLQAWALMLLTALLFHPTTQETE